MDSNGRSDGGLKGVDGLTVMDGSSTVMNGVARGNGWRDGSLMAMHGEGQHERDGNVLQLQWR